MTFHVLTVFPKILDSYFKESLFKRAIAKRLITIRTYNLRDFTDDKHRKVDGRPFGGGPGMVLKVQPIQAAIEFMQKRISTGRQKKKTRIILFSTRGKKLDNLRIICVFPPPGLPARRTIILPRLTSAPWR